MRKYKNQKGITLVALVVTIIVLLILAGVALSLVAGGDGILNRASTAADETNIATAKEQVVLKFYEYTTRYYEAVYVNKDVSINVQMGDWISYTYGAAEESTNSDGDTVRSLVDVTSYDKCKTAGVLLSTDNGEYEFTIEGTTSDLSDFALSNGTNTYTITIYGTPYNNKLSKNVIGTVDSTGKLTWLTETTE